MKTINKIMSERPFHKFLIKKRKRKKIRKTKKEKHDFMS